MFHVKPSSRPYTQLPFDDLPHRDHDPAAVAFEADLRSQLAALEGADLLREPLVLQGPERVRATIGDRSVLVFCSNDYLGLAADPRLADALRRASPQGSGAGASRLISGTHPAHRAAEQILADWVDAEAALLFSSGYAANVGALSALLDRHDVAFSDQLNHASLIDGLRLSRAEVHVYDHADPRHLEALLRGHREDGRRAMIVTDSLFSMDGDLAPLEALRDLADRYDAALFVDEAHALGVLRDGRGHARSVGVRPDVLVGTLGKAVGVAGAFVAGSSALRAVLENRARSYVFSTAIPPSAAFLVGVAATIARDADAERARVCRHTERLRAGLSRLGWSVPAGESPIIPVHIGPPEPTIALSPALLERGYYVRGIRPPTVPDGTSRLRVVPTAAHDDAMIDGLLDAFASLGPAPKRPTPPRHAPPAE